MSIIVFNRADRKCACFIPNVRACLRSCLLLCVYMRARVLACVRVCNACVRVCNACVFIIQYIMVHEDCNIICLSAVGCKI